jgi:sporulation protein YtfJ
MSDSNIKSIMDSTMNNLHAMVDADTIVGSPITVGDITLIPVSKVAFGLATGGSDFPSKNQQGLFGGGGGAGVTITPVAFLVISGGEVTLKHITAYDNAAERVVNLVPEMFDKVTGLINKTKAEPVAPAADSTEA